MSSRKENLHKQADILHQIAKASDAIRRKHKLMMLSISIQPVHSGHEFIF